MSNIPVRVRGQAPSHFQEFYPDFLKFMELYYRWLHREDNITPAELEMLKNDESWHNVDIDGFIRSGDENLLGGISLIDKVQQKPGGAEIDSMVEDYLLERGFDGFETADGEVFTDSAQRTIETSRRNEKHLDGWFKTMGFIKTVDKLIDDKGRWLTSDYQAFKTSDDQNIVVLGSTNDTRYRTLDNIRLLKVLKDLYSIRGTAKSVEIFFSLFFGESVSVHYPKTDILVLEDNFVADGTGVLRDDSMYNEYTYVIDVIRDPEYYEFYVENIFKKYFHPAGFNVFLRKVSLGS